VVVEIFDISDAVRLRAACAIRTSVFVDEQGVPPEEELDEHDRSDPAAVHVLARDPSGKPVGTGRYYVTEASTVRIGRMAVVASERGRGIGARILGALVDEARRRGFSRADLHAQTHALAFYIKAGFYEDGEELWDAGIRHQPMTRKLA